MTTPLGRFNVRGVIKTSAKQLRAAMRNNGTFNLEHLEIDVEFSHESYITVSPRNKEKIERLLGDEQVNYLKDIIDHHKSLNNMSAWADSVVRKGTACIQERVVEIQNNIKRALISGENSAVAKLDLSASRLKKQNDRIDRAMKILDDKIEEVTKLECQLRSIVADHVPPKSQIFRPKEKR